MTELENALLSAFEDLQKQHESQHGALRSMFEATSKKNQELESQINQLSRQVLRLSAQVESLSKQLCEKSA